MNIDEKYMRRAIQLAKSGNGSVSPNPMVGAVIVAKVMGFTGASAKRMPKSTPSIP